MLVTGIILLCLLLLGFVRFGVRVARTADGETRLVLRVGLLRINLLKWMRRKKAVKPKEKRVLPSTVKDFRSVVMPVLRALRRGVRIDCLRLRLAIAGEDDPCAAALLYGRLHTAWGILYPLLDETLRFKKRRIEFKLDFDSAKTVWEGDFSVTISIGRLIGVFLTAAGAYMKQEKASIPRKAV